MEHGILYGVGVGPGDPELMTLKAIRVIEEADVIVLPAKNRDSCYAYQIAKESVPDIEKKPILCRDFPMTRDMEKLREAMDVIYAEIAGYLRKKQQVALLTIGDPSIYSTYVAMHKRALQEGYAAQMISGVPSFCAVAARLGIPLGEGGEQIHILPASYAENGIEAFSGTRIYMKSGKKLAGLKEQLERECMKHPCEIYSVSNCGMPNECVGTGLDAIHPESGYLTIVIVKSGEKM